MAGQRPQGTQGAGFQPPPHVDKSQELLDATNALAYGLNMIAEMMPRLCETLEVVSQQFAVIIAAEAQRRNTTAEQFVDQMLMGLGSKFFGTRRRGG